jgi:chaperonin GroEL
LRSDNEDQRIGIDIIRRAIQVPLRQIAANAGEDGAVTSGKVLDKDEYAYGYDAQSGEFKDLVKAGIIGPAKVVRVALQDAASVAALIMTTEAGVVERPEKKARRRYGWHGRYGSLILLFMRESAQRRGSIPP